MRSTFYDRVLQEGEQKGQAELVALQLRVLLGEGAEPLLPALGRASEAQLLAVGRAIAQRKSKTKLRAVVLALLERAEG